MLCIKLNTECLCDTSLQSWCVENLESLNDVSNKNANTTWKKIIPFILCQQEYITHQLILAELGHASHSEV